MRFRESREPYSKKVRYFIDDKEVTEEEYRAKSPKKGKEFLDGEPMALMETSGAWPRKSDALGIHPKQKKKMEAMFKHHGVPTEFDATDGRAIIRNNAHQRDIMKVLKCHNNDGGYGQVTG